MRKGELFNMIFFLCLKWFMLDVLVVDYWGLDDLYLKLVVK